MDITDYIWSLAVKKLTNEASEVEANKLNELLEQNPEIAKDVNFVFEWRCNGLQNMAYGNYLFRKILVRIQNEGHALKYINN